jgi:mannosyltransferase
MKHLQKRELFILLIILLLTALLRLYHLGAEDLWLDEIYTVQRAVTPWADIQLSQLEPRDVLHFTFDFLIMHFWTKLGTTPVLIRLLSVIVGIGSIFVLYLVGKKLFNETIGLFSTLLFSLSSYHIYYSQEACAYAFQLFMILSLVYFYLQAVDKSNWGYWVLVTFISLFAIALREFSVFSWLALNCYFLVRLVIIRKHKTYFRIVPWLITQGSILIVCLLALLIYFMRPGADTYGSWVPQPVLADIGKSLALFSLGWEYWRLPDFLQYLVIPIFLFTFIFALLKVNQESKILKIFSIETNSGALLCGSLILIPALLFFLISLKKPILFPYRYIIIMLPFFYLLIGYGVSKLPSKTLAFAGMVIMLLGMLIGLYEHYTTIRKIPWSQVAQVLEQQGKPDDIILITPEYWSVPLDYYLESPMQIQPILDDRDIPKISRVINNHSRVWMITVSDWLNKPVNEMRDLLNLRYTNRQKILILTQPSTVKVVLYTLPKN